MTKVQIRFKIQKPLDDSMLARISDAHAFYGIQKIQLAPAMDSLMVEYDATRLKPAQIESALMGAGIPVVRE
jgi:allophanate hydrolase subunit 1